MRAEFYCNTSEEIALVLEFAQKIEALRAARYPQAMNSGIAVANANTIYQAQAAEKAASL